VSATVIKHEGRLYGAEKIDGKRLQVFAPNHSAVFTSASGAGDDFEEEARRWLSDHTLRKSKAKKLLAAALRGEGEFADPNHPKRVTLP